MAADPPCRPHPLIVIAPLSHAWTEYPNGAAHCPVCGAGRQPDGTVIIGGLPSCEPKPTRRVVDGVIVDDSPPQYSRLKK